MEIILYHWVSSGKSICLLRLVYEQLHYFTVNTFLYMCVSYSVRGCLRATPTSKEIRDGQKNCW